MMDEFRAEKINNLKSIVHDYIFTEDSTFSDIAKVWQGIFSLHSIYDLA